MVWRYQSTVFVFVSKSHLGTAKSPITIDPRVRVPPMLERGQKRSAVMLIIKEVSRCRSRREFEESRQKGTQVRDPPWLWKPGQMSPEVQNKGISGPTKFNSSPMGVVRKILFILNLFRTPTPFDTGRTFRAKLTTLFWIQNRETSQIRFGNPSFVHLVP